METKQPNPTSARDRETLTSTTSTGDTVTFYNGGTYVTQITSTTFSVNVTATGTQYSGQAFDELVADVDADVIVTALAPVTGGTVTVETIQAETYRPSGSSETRVGGGLVFEESGTDDMKLTFSPPDVADHKVTWSFDDTAPPVLFKAVIKRRT